MFPIHFLIQAIYFRHNQPQAVSKLNSNTNHPFSTHTAYFEAKIPPQHPLLSYWYYLIISCTKYRLALQFKEKENASSDCIINSDKCAEAANNRSVT